MISEYYNALGGLFPSPMTPSQPTEGSPIATSLATGVVLSAGFDALTRFRNSQGAVLGTALFAAANALYQLVYEQKTTTEALTSTLGVLMGATCYLGGASFLKRPPLLPATPAPHTPLIHNAPVSPVPALQAPIYWSKKTTPGGNSSISPALAAATRQIISSYTKASPDARKQLSMFFAHTNHTRVFDPKTPAAARTHFLTHSPLWARTTELYTLSKQRDRFGLPRKNLQIACYGGGFHCESTHWDASLAPTDEVTQRYKTDLLKLLRHTEGQLPFTQGGQSNEPKALLTLFLPGETTGALHVFDRDKRVEDNLKIPHFVYTTFVETLFGRTDEAMPKIQHEATFWSVLRKDREPHRQMHGIWPYTNKPMISESIAFSEQEMAKLTPHTIDLITDGLSEHRDQFHLSTCFDLLYFVPPGVQDLVLARIIGNMKVGGILVTDSLFAEPKLRGLQIVDRFTNPLQNGPDAPSAFVYKKTHLSPYIKEWLNFSS